MGHCLKDTATGSEVAFAELVRKHPDLVYSAALRTLSGDEHLARDVSQTVFMDVGRKASQLSNRLELSDGFTPVLFSLRQKQYVLNAAGRPVNKHRSHVRTVPAHQGTNVGFASPAAALQTLNWSIAPGCSASIFSVTSCSQNPIKAAERFWRHTQMKSGDHQLVLQRGAQQP